MNSNGICPLYRVLYGKNSSERKIEIDGIIFIPGSIQNADGDIDYWRALNTKNQRLTNAGGNGLDKSVRNRASVHIV